MNSETRNKLRKLQKAFYSAKRVLDFHLDISKTPMYFMAEYMSLAVIGEIQRMPWQVFCINKPEIDEHRAKAWHRLESYRRKKDIESGKVFIVNGLQGHELITGKKIQDAIKLL